MKEKIEAALYGGDKTEYISPSTGAYETSTLGGPGPPGPPSPSVPVLAQSPPLLILSAAPALRLSPLRSINFNCIKPASEHPYSTSPAASHTAGLVMSSGIEQTWAVVALTIYPMNKSGRWAAISQIPHKSGRNKQCQKDE